ncbi:MAG: putative glycolipid-binding domain-containing protein, partial [Marmoricola sp.]|nr:putative glycolipid-binding domain-containing protein [Marmoricola sp.]
RLEQRYERLADEDGVARYHYTAPRFDYAGELRYDASGLVLAYPGLAERVR